MEVFVTMVRLTVFALNGGVASALAGVTERFARQINGLNRRKDETATNGNELRCSGDVGEGECL